MFSHDEAAGRVTAVIEILYQGPAEQFAWILPVAGVPEVDVSTNAMLNRLQQATNPNYQLQRSWREDCNVGREEALDTPAPPSGGMSNHNAVSGPTPGCWARSSGC